MPNQLDEILRDLESDPAFRACVTRRERIPARPGKYVDLPAALDPRLRKAIESRGIGRLYSHQAECYELARAGKNLVVVTPTASGKTLCYNLPVLETLLQDPAAKALYLFPTKALSQDQQSELNEAVLGGGIPVKVATYDGDTPSSLRVSLRESGRIVITNPDMLHTGILPNHTKWIKFLKSLRFVVIDEMHAYRGIFGSHLTNLVRRLKRVTRFYGSEPRFILCSATIANPKELAEKLVEEEVALVDDNGAPSGERHLLFYNPPLVDPVQGLRRSTVTEAQGLALKFLKRRIKTIVFARSRLRVELIASAVNAALKNLFTDNDRIRFESYRGGYLPNERRAIEKGLRTGEIMGVASTNALELGIDIGGLDASILAGFPGSIASTWQQAGRAGRRQTVSVSVLIASSLPMNQYLVNHPEYFLTKSPEAGFVDPDNMYVAVDHLKCAVFELPFTDAEVAEGRPFSPHTESLLSYLEEHGVVRHAGGTWYWSDRSYPAEQVSLRSAAAGNVVIVDTTAGRNEVIGEMDRPSAKELIFDNAVYLHRGAQYIVKKLDIENKRCDVEESNVNYYTDAVVKTDIKVLKEDETSETAGVKTVLGDILVRTQAAKFKKIRFDTHENIGFGEIFLPPEEMHTRALALLFATPTRAGEAFGRVPETAAAAAVGRLGYLVRNTAPVFLLCDPADIGVSEKIRDPHFGVSALYVYDRCPGGTGLAEAFREKLPEILAALRERLGACPCRSGCPSCVGPVEGTGPTDVKDVLKRFVSDWAG
ncbi:MAG: DEAD/DEAH box helicase [Spirochaetales bacterium]|nr:DEAD/DEAH box helicase [Spirochaetales bacterium]